MLGALTRSGCRIKFDCGKPQWTIAFQNVQVIFHGVLEFSEINRFNFQDLFHFYKIKQLPETRQTDDGKHLIRHHVQVNDS
jgi:hypothetical protein